MMVCDQTILIPLTWHHHIDDAMSDFFLTNFFDKWKLKGGGARLRGGGAHIEKISTISQNP